MSNIEEKINHEQIRLIYQQGPALIAGGSLCAVILTVFLWWDMPHVTLIWWLAAVGVVGALRLLGIHVYNAADQQRRKLPRWGPLFWIGSLAAGIVWGSWPLCFYSEYNPNVVLMIAATFAAMVAASAASGSVYLPAFLTFSIPLVAPFSIAHVLSGPGTMVVTGLLVMAFLGINLILALRANRGNRELISSKLENQKLMERLEEEKRIAEQAMVAKSRFLAAASHDLRQPLHAMGLFISALKRRETDSRNQLIIEDMSKSSEALNSLFNSLLDVSRLDAEIIDFNPVHVPASRIFDALYAQFKQQAAKKNIGLHIVTTKRVLYADVVLLERVLRNLLANAVQYTEEGEITLSCNELDENTFRITLKDTGIGIPDEYLEDVFSEYYQLNNPARDRNKGLGLGLSIVRRLCELMDLPLQLTSIDGEGSVFHVDVPVGNSAKVMHRTRSEAANVATGKCILVIDDDYQVLQSMRHMLEGWGSNVMVAKCARDALQTLALSDGVPDVVISDYRLEDNRNGIDAIAVVREAVDTMVPAIVITGDTSPERLKQVNSSGLRLLHKPVDADELHDVIQALLSDELVTS